jgi:translation elongation factor EF-1beta
MAIKTKRLIYTARNFATGLSDVVAQIRRNGALVGSNVALSEIGNGRYELVLTPAQIATYGGAGFYDYFINSATQSAPAISSGWILENDEDDLASLLGTQDAKLATIEGKIDNLDGDVSALDAKVVVQGGKIDSIKTTVEGTNAEVTSAQHGLAVLKGLIASVNSSVANIQNATRFVGAVPAQMIEPGTGSKSYRLPLRIYNGQGQLEDPDMNEIEVTVVDEVGSSRKSYLAGFVAEGTPVLAVRDSLGAYHIDLSIPAGASIEQLNFEFKYAENGTPVSAVRTTHVVPESASEGLALEATLQSVKTTVESTEPKVDAIKSLLENATYGLSALEALVQVVNQNTDGVEGLLNDPSFGLQALKTVIESKASQASLDALATLVGTKASQASVDSLDAKVDTKSSQASVNAVQQALDERLYLGGHAF